MKIHISVIICLASIGLFATPALASDVTAGEKVFKKCKACHVVGSAKHKTGPHLVKLFGRAAGTVDGYKRYSEAMKSSGIVWNEETLHGYLEKPKAYVEGTRMIFAGLKKESDRANVIAYLKTFSE